MELGERLKEERQRLDLTQQALSDACGVSKRAQVKYESGEQTPGGAYLAAAAQLGVDVVFVLTGNRAAAGNAEEALLLAAYRSAAPAVKNVVLAALGANATAAAPAGIKIKGGNQAQVIQGSPDQKNLTIHVGRKKKT